MVDRGLWSVTEAGLDWLAATELMMLAVRWRGGERRWIRKEFLSSCRNSIGLAKTIGMANLYSSCYRVWSGTPTEIYAKNWHCYLIASSVRQQVDRSRINPRKKNPRKKNKRNKKQEQKGFCEFEKSSVSIIFCISSVINRSFASGKTRKPVPSANWPRLLIRRFLQWFDPISRVR